MSGRHGHKKRAQGSEQAPVASATERLQSHSEVDQSNRAAVSAENRGHRAAAPVPNIVHKPNSSNVALLNLGVTIAIAAIYLLQLRSMQKSVNIADETMRIDQRAWVGTTEVLPPAFVEDGKLAYLKAGQESTFDVFLANSGKTPARNVTYRISYRTLPASVAFSPRYTTDPTRAGVIQPGTKLVGETPATEKATAAQINTYRTNANILYFYGEMTYDDIFGVRQHHTTFCMYLLKDLSKFVDCGTYNDAD